MYVEAEYTYQLHKDIIPLMMDGKYRPDGWLGFIVGSKFWIDFSEKHKLDSNVSKLVKELGTRGKIELQENTVKGMIKPKLLYLVVWVIIVTRTDCLPSSLDSKAEESKYVSNVLRANGYTKPFLRNCQKSVTAGSTPDEREPATDFVVIPCIQGVTEPIQIILNSHNVKVTQKPFQNLGHIFAKPNERTTNRRHLFYSLQWLR